MEKSNFRFLYDNHARLAALADQAEASIWLNPRGTLIQGRLFSEQLAKLVAVQEGIEPVFEVKQVERVHKLAREEIITVEIKDNFEWLRRNGNTAAHSEREVYPDVALTAYRHIFELAVWYVETYGSIDTIIPVYRMPLQQTQVLDPIVSPHTDLINSDVIERTLFEKFEEKLLPALDEKFRDLQNTVLKLTKIQNEAGKPLTKEDRLSHIVTEKIQEQKDVHHIDGLTIRSTDSILMETDYLYDTRALLETTVENINSIEIKELLEQNELDLIDKRPLNGALWILGGWELKEKLDEFKLYGLHFRFAHNGSNSTKRKPAWFLLGKVPSAERWVSLNSVVQGQNQNRMQSVDTLASQERKSNFDHSKELLYLDLPSIQQAESNAISSKEQSTSNDQTANSVWVPITLRDQLIEKYVPSRLASLSAELGALTFSDWDEERLLKLYEQQSKLLHDVMTQLWFFGFRFQRKLARVLKLQHQEGEQLISLLQENIALQAILPIDVCRSFLRFGMTQSQHLSYLPVSSLEWLLKGRHQDTLDRLQGIEKRLDEAANSEEDEIYSSQRDLHYFFQGEELIIDHSWKEVLIKDLPILGCNALIRGIQQDWNIQIVAELPEALSILPTRIKGVGTSAVAKFFEQLNIITISSSNTKSSNDEEAARLPTNTNQVVAEKLTIYHRDEQFKVEKRDLDFPLDLQTILNMPKLIEEMHNVSIKQVGSLPVNLEKLLEIPRVGRGAIDKFYKQLATALIKRREQQDYHSTWLELSHEERIKKAFQDTNKLWKTWMEEQSVQAGKQRNLDILKARYDHHNIGRLATLEEVGQAYGLTRERVRQVLNKQLLRLQIDIKDLEQSLRMACDKNNGFYYYALPESCSFEEILAVEILENLGINYIKSYNWWTCRSIDSFVNFERNIHQEIRELYRGKILEPEDIENSIIALAIQYSFPAELLRMIIMSQLKLVNKEYYILRNTNKADVVEMILRLYPSGVEIFKQVKDLIEKAHQFCPNLFRTDREFTSVVARDEFSDIAYLWGRGTYIHFSYVTFDSELIGKIALTAEQQLETRSPISIGRLYAQYEFELEHSGITNEYALYTLLRKYNADNLQLKKFPHLWHAQDGFRVSNSGIIKNYIRERNHAISIEELVNEFVKKRGWKRFTLDYNFSTDTDFIHADLGMISLREFYNLSSNDFTYLFQQFQEVITNMPVIHINRLFEKEKSYCKQLGITSSYELYDLMKSQYKEEYKFVRFPLIALADQEWEEMSLKTITEQYILEQGVEVPREQIVQWLTEELGARESTIDIVLSYSKDIFYYMRGRYGEYIHRDNIGWNEEKEQQLNNWIDLNIRKTQEQESEQFVLASNLLKVDKLPKLEEELIWTEDLLVDIIRKNKQFRLIGSYDRIVVAMDNIQIQNETDFVTYILKKHLNGRATEVELYQKLKSLGYSKDGQFLQDTSNKLESGTAPFQVINSYFVI